MGMANLRVPEKFMTDKYQTLFTANQIIIDFDNTEEL